VAKDSPRITDGEFQRLVDSWGQKDYEKKQRKKKHHMLFGRVSRKILVTHPKTNTCVCGANRDL